MDNYGWNKNEFYGRMPGSDGRSPGFESASLILGIAALFTASCGVGIFLGSLAVIFGLLSKGGTMTLSSRAKAGIWLGVAGIVATAITYIVSFVIVIMQFGGIDGFVQQYEQLYRALESGNAADLAEVYNALYGGLQ